MILDHTKPAEGSRSLFEMGTCHAIYNEGHAEYHLNNTKVVWDVYDEIALVDVDDIILRADNEPAYNDLWYDQDLKEWGTLVEFKGDTHALAVAFYELSVKLDPKFDPADYTPGGDDDTYDYYPSGMRLLYEVAVDLSALTLNNRYRDRYMEVLRNVIAFKGDPQDWEFYAPMLEEAIA